jgi:hypothetical protein
MLSSRVRSWKCAAMKVARGFSRFSRFSGKSLIAADLHFLIISPITPEEDGVGMGHKPSENGESSQHINAKLSAWLDEARKVLGMARKAATPAERVAAYQELRDSGFVSPPTGFFMVATAIDQIVDEEMTEAKSREPLKGIGERMKAIEESHGLERCCHWLPREGPDMYEALRDQWERIAAELQADVLRAFGEDEMADLLVNSSEDFERRMDEGARELRDTDWLL